MKNNKRAKQLLVLATTLALLASPWGVQLNMPAVTAMEEGAVEDDPVPVGDDGPVGDDDPTAPLCEDCGEPLSSVTPQCPGNSGEEHPEFLAGSPDSTTRHPPRASVSCAASRRLQ